ncbi:UNVERIFIED_CONTAM: Loganic acid O-methyltransferase [Sesamum latifolium]|uniref:Loganic acid O-methyltransferase n=1 Tax=Sesamum latifolium TaxID=2727402 RepID=A0AAW2YCH9_9LAMI
MEKMSSKKSKLDIMGNGLLPRRTLDLYAMNAGDGPRSYVQNSSYQRGVVDIAKPIIEDEIARKLDIKNLSSTSPNCIWVADFGCSTGHNSFPAMQIVTQAIYQKHMLFSRLSKGELLVLQRDRKEVCAAYLNQYAKDIEAFLEARAVEMVSGGLMALLISGVPASWNPDTEYTLPSDINLLGSCVMDMAKKGRFSEAKVDSFNLPLYFTTPEQLKTILERSYSFTIERFEILNNPGKHALRSVNAHAAFYRAVIEGPLTNHFGSDIMDELFDLYMEKLAASPVFLNPDNDKSIVILAVLKRRSD